MLERPGQRKKFNTSAMSSASASSLFFENVVRTGVTAIFFFARAPGKDLLLFLYLTSCRGDYLPPIPVTDCKQLKISGLSTSASPLLAASDEFQWTSDGGWVSLAESKKDTMYLFQATDGTWYMGKDAADPSTGRLNTRLGIKAWSVAESKSSTPDPGASITFAYGFPTPGGWRSQSDADSLVIEESGVKFACTCKGASLQDCKSPSLTASTWITMWVVISVISLLVCSGVLIMSLARIRKPARPNAVSTLLGDTEAPADLAQNGAQTQIVVGSSNVEAVLVSTAKSSPKQMADELVTAIYAAGLCSPSRNAFKFSQHCLLWC